MIALPHGFFEIILTNVSLVGIDARMLWNTIFDPTPTCNNTLDKNGTIFLYGNLVPTHARLQIFFAIDIRGVFPHTSHGQSWTPLTYAFSRKNTFKTKQIHATIARHTGHCLGRMSLELFIHVHDQTHEAQICAKFNMLKSTEHWQPWPSKPMWPKVLTTPNWSCQTDCTFP